MQMLAKQATLFLLLFWGLWGSGIAQNPGYLPYSVREGLPSTNIYCIDFDADGIMWVGTEYGIASFDGQRFRCYGRTSGLPGLDILELVTEGPGIWLRTYNQGVGYWQPGQYWALPSHLAKGARSQAHPQRAGRKVVFPVRYRSLTLVYSSGKWEWKLGRTMVWWDDRGRQHEIWPDKHLIDGRVVAEYAALDGITLVHAGVLYLVNERGLYRIVDGPPEFLTAIPNHSDCQEIAYYKGRIMLGYSDGLVEVAPSADDFVTRSYFDQFNVQAIAVDFEEGLWLGTQQNGLIYVPDLDVQRYAFANSNQVYGVEVTEEGTVYAAGSTNQLLRIVAGRSETLRFARRGRGRAQDMFRIGDNEVLTVFDHQLIQNGGERKTRQFWGSLKAVAVDTAGIAYISERYYGLFRIPLASFLDYSDRSPMLAAASGNPNWVLGGRRLHDWAQDIYVDPARNAAWWLGENGLFREQAGEIAQVSIWPKENGKIGGWPGGKVVVATSDTGLYVVEEDHLRRWELDLGTPLPHFQNLVATSNQTWWLASRQGIYRIEGIAGDSQAVVQHLGRASGFPFRAVNDIAVRHGEVWVAADEGLFHFSESLIFRPRAAPRIILDSLVANGKMSESGSDFPHQTAVRVHFRGLSFSDVKGLHYEYRFAGPQEPWRRVGESQLYFPTMEAGEYVLQVRAIRPLGKPSKILEVAWTILPPFWRKGWFILLVGLGLILLGAGLVALTVTIQRSAQRRRLRMVDLERRALRARMNPHFLFNALNAIHVFIGNQEDRKAHLFLSKFAKLTRIVLSSSAESYISLADELKAARYYLDLEQVRMGKCFDYEIIVEIPDAPDKIAVPSLLIQPFIENAVLHGVRHLEGRKGMIRIVLTGNGRLGIRIEDNGIGREAAARINQDRSKGHASQGSRITVERIQLIKGAEIKIIDLQDANDHFLGTACQIYLPWKFMN